MPKLTYTELLAKLNTTPDAVARDLQVIEAREQADEDRKRDIAAEEASNFEGEE